MRRTRVIALVIAIATVLVLGTGVALAATRGGRGPTWSDQMHASQQMQTMHGQMPASAHAECDAMHEQMSGRTDETMRQMHGQAGMGAMHGHGQARPR